MIPPHSGSSTIAYQAPQNASSCPFWLPSPACAPCEICCDCGGAVEWQPWWPVPNVAPLGGCASVALVVESERRSAARAPTGEDRRTKSRASLGQDADHGRCNTPADPASPARPEAHAAPPGPPSSNAARCGPEIGAARWMIPPPPPPPPPQAPPPAHPAPPAPPPTAPLPPPFPAPAPPP